MSLNKTSTSSAPFNQFVTQSMKLSSKQASQRKKSTQTSQAKQLINWIPLPAAHSMPHFALQKGTYRTVYEIVRSIWLVHTIQLENPITRRRVRNSHHCIVQTRPSRRANNGEKRKKRTDSALQRYDWSIYCHGRAHDQTLCECVSLHRTYIVTKVNRFLVTVTVYLRIKLR